MRRRLGRLIPIMMLAVLVQLFAPIAIMRASAAAVADPLSGTIVCENMGGSGAAHDPDDPHNHCMCCPLCALTHAVTPLGDPPAVHIAIHRAYQSVVWLEGQSPPVLSVFGSSQQARAPPFRS